MDKQELIIIGNGFDLHHGLKTNYLDYRDFLIKSGDEKIVKCYERGISNDDSESITYLWSNIESLLGLLDYELAYPLLKDYGDDDWTDDFHHAFQTEIEKMAEYWPDIKLKLSDWIKTVSYTECDNGLKYLINNNSNYISFNYTNTLEELYGIEKDNICYIHGDASVESDLVLGHKNDSYYPEWDDNNQDEDVRLLNAGRFMESFRKKTLKPVEAIIENNSQFKSMVCELKYSKIYILGLSYNDIDAAYLKYIASNQKSKWVFTYYADKEINDIMACAKKLGVNDYDITTINLLQK